MMDNTKIDWADMTWNPVTGCRHGCEYCYAARTAGRFAGYLSQGVKVSNDTRKEEIVQEVKKPNCEREGIVVLDKPLKTMTAAGNVVNAPYPFGFTPTFHRYRLGDPARKQRPRNIFVCSMADLFGAWVPTKWILEVLDACLAAPQHNYLFLTKNPRRYTELNELALLPRRDNFWYGTTTTEAGQSYFISEHHKTFTSVEPMTGPLFAQAGGILVDWVIVGAETGQRKDKVVPERAWVEDLLGACREEGVPVFMKGNLAGVWGKDLVQETPRPLRHG